MKKNIFLQPSLVTSADGQKKACNSPAILWFTCLSGASKSTLAHAVELALYESNFRTFVIDRDNVRHGLCSDLCFSALDRQKNIRRVGEVSKLFIEAGVKVLIAFISPFIADRNRVRALVNSYEFIEIYYKADLAVCEKRDVKGLYAKTRRGEIADFNEISSPYEPPVKPELELDTGAESLDCYVNKVMEYL